MKVKSGVKPVPGQLVYGGSETKDDVPLLAKGGFVNWNTWTSDMVLKPKELTPMEIQRQLLDLLRREY